MEQQSQQTAGAAGESEVLGLACDSQLFICSSEKVGIHILYRSLVWGAVNTERLHLLQAELEMRVKRE